MLKSNNYLNGVVFCLIATLSWDAMFPMMTHTLLIIDPFSFTAFRYTIAGIAFLIFLYARALYARNPAEQTTVSRR